MNDVFLWWKRGWKILQNTESFEPVDSKLQQQHWVEYYLILANACSNSTKQIVKEKADTIGKWLLRALQMKKLTVKLADISEVTHKIFVKVSAVWTPIQIQNGVYIWASMQAPCRQIQCEC